MLLGLVSLALAAPLSACPERWPARALEEAVAAADASAARMDPAGLLAARDTLLARLACVEEPLTGTLVGGVHRVVATAAFLEDDDGRVVPALAGLVAADPGYQLPLELYPEGHPLRRLLGNAGRLARDGGARPLAPPAAGWLEVDGLSTATAPAERAAVIQALDGAGAVVETRYVWPEAPLGAWGAPSLPAAAPKARAARVPLAVATALSAAAAGTLYGLAAADRAAFDDVESGLSDAELLALRDRTNALTVGWIGAGVATVGLGVGLAFAW